MTNWLDRTVSARLLFIWACALAPALLLPTPIPVRAAQMVVLAAGAIGAGRRLRWLRTALFFTAVVGFNLATPGGRVLLEVMRFPVTDGALHAGLTKALALTNLLLLSRIAIRRDLELPGAAGRLISLTLAYVRYLLDADLKLLARDPVGRLDRLLLAAQRNVAAAGPAAPAGGADAPGAGDASSAAVAGSAGAPRAGHALPRVVVLVMLLAANWATVLVACGTTAG